MSSQCETEIKDCIHLYKKRVYKDRKETTHGEIGEKTYNNTYENQI